VTIYYLSFWPSALYLLADRFGSIINNTGAVKSFMCWTVEKEFLMME
jgi:hypothetical protein